MKYRLKEAQHRIETMGLTKEQLKAKFEKQIADAKADMKKNGQDIERDMKAMDCKMKDHHHRDHHKK